MFRSGSVSHSCMRFLLARLLSIFTFSAAGDVVDRVIRPLVSKKTSFFLIGIRLAVNDTALEVVIPIGHLATAKNYLLPDGYSAS